MILDRPTFERLTGFAADACIIGSGPVGIATALDLAEKGFRVLVLESGGMRASKAARALSEAESVSRDTHGPVEQSSARQFGGTTNLWGGRCVPYDLIDFRSRPWLDLPPWPIDEADIATYLARACALLGAGPPTYSDPLAGFGADGGFHVGALERWCRVPRLRRLHGRALARAGNILVALHATALGFDYGAGQRITAVRLHLGGEGYARLPVPLVILAAGGIESVRLLLAEQRRRPQLFGGPDGPLGRYYMGHIGGRIADITIADPTLKAAVDFHVDRHGTYVRRRIAPSEALQEAERLANIVFWPVVPPISDPAHASGPLSAVFLVLSFGWIGRRLLAATIRERHIGDGPYRRRAHLANVLREPWRTLSHGPRFLWNNRVRRPRLPGLFIPNAAGRYGISYHAEHLPDAESRLTLAERTDALGLPRLRIDLRFSDTDIASVLRAHGALDQWLRDNRIGALEHRFPEAERAAAVRKQAWHGCHQIGMARMGTCARQAVVDPDCRSFDVPNLYVISSAVLPTSGQAHPTVATVQLGLRLADRLAGEARPERPAPVRQADAAQDYAGAGAGREAALDVPA